MMKMIIEKWGRSKALKLILLGALIIFLVGLLVKCGSPTPTAGGQVMATEAEIVTGATGETVEQLNIRKRIEADNTPGSLKYLYGFSPYSGELLIYSTVDGKVTSSGKSLRPKSSTGETNNIRVGAERSVVIHGTRYVTNELLSEDGTFGHSIPYLYWFDTNGIYHQLYASGIMIIVRDQPLALPDNAVKFMLTE